MDKEFDKIFSRLCRTRNAHRVWQDFVTLSALEFSQIADFRQDRKDSYMRIIEDYSEEERDDIARLLTRTAMALEENPEQDFLGQLYMEYRFGNIRLGQHFTPYNVSYMMAMMTLSAEEIEQKGWMAVNDPTCGSGVLLIAAANCLKAQGTNYHDRVLFIGQDLDSCIAMMCYIQISLLGCAGYVIVGNSLTEPQTGDVLFAPQGNTWITPMYFKKTWHWRRALQLVQSAFIKE